MSTNSQNINISPQNVQGYCDMKCSYNFNYQESGSTATNNGVMISTRSLCEPNCKNTNKCRYK